MVMGRYSNPNPAYRRGQSERHFLIFSGLPRRLQMGVCAGEGIDMRRAGQVKIVSDGGCDLQPTEDDHTMSRMKFGHSETAGTKRRLPCER